MIYIVQIIQESGARSPAFPIWSIVDFIRNVHDHAVKNGDWEDVKKCGLLVLNAIFPDQADPICSSALPVYSLDRYMSHIEAGSVFPDLQLSSIVKTVEDSYSQDTVIVNIGDGIMSSVDDTRPHNMAVHVEI